MPSVQVYIREEDYDKWKAIEKKSEFIHNALKEPDELISTDATKGTAVSTVKPASIPSVFVKPIGSFCKHGYDPKFCKHAKPNRPCK